MNQQKHVTVESITDEQIRELRKEGPSTPGMNEWRPEWLRIFAIALGTIRTVNDPEGDRRIAREIFAEMWNRRQRSDE